MLLLHFDDGNGSTAFTDSSPSATNFQSLHGAAESIANPKFGIGSWVSQGGLSQPVPYRILAASGDPIDLHAAAAWTIEGWVYCTTTVSLNIFTIGNDVSASFPAGVQITTDGGANLKVNISGPTSGPGGVPSPGALSPNTWHHFAVVKTPNTGGGGGDLYQVFLDGVGGGWSGVSPPYQGPYTTWGGQWAVVAGYFDQGFGDVAATATGTSVDEIRITASAVYTANFTPPTGPFPNTGTSPDGYDIYRNGPSIAITTGAPGFNDVVPVPGTYTYTVAAQNGGVDSSPQSSPFTITIGATLGTTPNFLDDEAIGGAYVNSKLTLVEFTYLPEREPFLEGATNLIINRYKQEPTDVRQRGVDYTYFAVPGELLQTVAVEGISAQGVLQEATSPLVTPLVVTELIIDPVTQLKFAYTVSGGQNGVEYTVQFRTTTQIQTSNVEEIFSINILVEDSFP